MDYRARSVIPVILSIASAIGTVGTAILVAKETPKALEKIKNAEESSKIKLNLISKAKLVAPIYAPAIAVGLATISSTIGSTIVSRRVEASLTATAIMLNQGYVRYKDKIKEALGGNVAKKISNELSKDQYDLKKDKLTENNKDGKKLYYEEHLGFFRSTELDIANAIADTNQRLHTMADEEYVGTIFAATLYTLAKDANADVLDKNKLEASKNIGWTYDYLNECYGAGNIWIHPQFIHAVDKATGEEKYEMITFWEDVEVLPPYITNGADRKEDDIYHKHNAEIDLTDAEEDKYRSQVEDEYELNGSKYDGPSDDPSEGFKTCSEQDPDNNQIRYLDGKDPYAEESKEDISTLSMPDQSSIPSK